MSEIAGIISFDTLSPKKEQLDRMLSWSSQSSQAIDFHEFRNSLIGIQNGGFYSDANNGITVFLSGSLLQKEKILEREFVDSSFSNDAELIALAYRTYGKAVFHTIEGSFLIIIIDEASREIVCARDRMGAEELFWYQNQNTCLFSSSIKALLSTGQISATPDLYALSSYLFLGYISQDKTAIKGISKLLPGYVLTASLDGKITISSFWSFSAAFQKSKKHILTSSEELYKEINEKITSSLLRRHKKEKRSLPAVFGSSNGSKVIQKLFLENSLEPPIPSIGVEFQNYGSDQGHSPLAMRQITPEMFLKNLIPMIWTLEAPQGDPLQVAYWEFLSLAQKHNLTPFFDTGFTTIFGEESHLPKLHDFESDSHHEKRLTTRLYQFFSKIAPSIALPRLRTAQKKESTLLFIERYGQFSETELKRVSPTLGTLFQTDLFLHQFYHLPRVPESAAGFYLSLKAEVSDKWYSSQCKMAKAFQVDIQAPFIDTELLEFLASLSNETWASPDLLPRYPESILQDAGYAPFIPSPLLPLESWMSHPHIMRLIQHLEKGLLVESGFLSADYISKIKKHINAKSFTILYSFIALEVWMRLFIDLPLSPSNGEMSIDELLLKR